MTIAKKMRVSLLEAVLDDMTYLTMDPSIKKLFNFRERNFGMRIKIVELVEELELKSEK